MFRKIALAFALAWCTASYAHVPVECVPLFQEAGRDNQQAVNQGQITLDTANATLERSPGVEEYLHLAELISQWAEALMVFYASMTKAVQCADST